MADDQGKWNFTNDEERRLAIEAEAEASADIARANADAASKWWLVWGVLVLLLGTSQLIAVVRGQPTPSLFSLTLGKDSK